VRAESIATPLNTPLVMAVRRSTEWSVALHSANPAADRPRGQNQRAAGLSEGGWGHEKSASRARVFSVSNAAIA